MRAEPRAEFLGIAKEPPREPVTAMGWEVAPDSLYEMLTRIKRDYGDLPIYITENGAAYDDDVAADGSVDDPRRVEFYRSHLAALERAIDEGVDVRGYFAGRCSTTSSGRSATRSASASCASITTPSAVRRSRAPASTAT